MGEQATSESVASPKAAASAQMRRELVHVSGRANEISGKGTVGKVELSRGATNRECTDGMTDERFHLQQNQVNSKDGEDVIEPCFVQFRVAQRIHKELPISSRLD